MLAAIRYLRKFNPLKIVVAVPVCPSNINRIILRESDEFICLDKEDLFAAVGQFYENFEQVSDDEVIAILNEN
ncbi:putative phosphoribosyl transferase [compost metagenome]